MSNIYYKATDKDMQCRGVQFVLGEWSNPVEGELKMCENGYHFCTSPSGVWVYYNNNDTRVFEIEVEDAIMSTDVGASAKSICRRVKLVKEITPSKENGWNTGDSNTGNWNTGYRNTGYSNTGYSNTGYRNTGDSNTGYSNTGNRNTGNRNTGDRNTGYWNTGDSNTGNWNTGNRNTGDRNTGDWNIGDRHSGVFGVGEAPFTSFGVVCDRNTFNFNEASVLYCMIVDGKSTQEIMDHKSWDIVGLTIESLTRYIDAYNKAINK